MFLMLLTGSFAFAESRTVVVPQFAAGTGGGLKITTTITLVNLGTGVLNPARVDVATFDESGNPANLLKQNTLGGVQAVATLQREIPGRGTAVVESHSASGSLATGWASLTTEDNVAVEVLFSIYDAASNKLITSTSILPSQETEAGTVIVSVNSATSLYGALAVSLAPTASGPAEVTADVYDQFGNFVGSGEFTVEPGQKIARNWTQLVSALAGRNGFVGTAEVVSTQPVVMLPLRQDGVQLTAQAVLANR